jgi:hypothetical protein
VKGRAARTGVLFAGQRSRVPALLAQHDVIAYNSRMQYTLRNVPAFVDRILRRLARERGASLNDVALEALARGAGATEERVVRRKLRDLAGGWMEDPEFEAAIREQDTVDERLWR